MNKIKELMNNPIVKREIKQTFRKSRIFWIMMIYLLALSGVSFYIFGVVSSLTEDYSPESAMAMYFVIYGMQFIIMTFIAPMTTAGAISGEKERQTFDLLVITKTSMKDVVIGKLLSSLMLVGILIILSMPVYAVVFYYGGVTIINFIFNLLYLMCHVTMVGALGLVFSTIMKKTTAATTATISLLFAASIGVWILIGMIAGFMGLLLRDTELWRFLGILIVLNPIVSFISIIDSQVGSDISWNIIEELSFNLANDYVYAWHINMIFYIIITVILVRFAAKRIAPIRRK